MVLQGDNEKFNKLYKGYFKDPSQRQARDKIE